jgi:hypothetical protein|tara:strand:- start:36 stop:449 length:414 start_codon:yes stop_codon:yes gene_type:complete
MKKFKDFIQEQYGHQEDAGLSSEHIPHDIDDHDVKQKINAVLGHTASSEYMNPRAAIAQMEAKLALLGLNSKENVNDLEFAEGAGEFDLNFSRYGEIIGKSVDTPHDEIDHEEKIVSLHVRYEQLETGSFKVYGSLS